MADTIGLRRSLSEGLASWLTFEALCGRDDLFSERYLALPIAQILAKNVAGRILAEHNHPILSGGGAPGRPPQIDFAVEQDGSVALVLESKWARGHGVKVKDVIWDCVRLELAAQHYGCAAIFVLAGRRSDVDAVLASAPFNPVTKKGRPSLILGLHGSGRFSVNVESPRRGFGPALHQQLAAYPNVRYPKSFVCGHGAQIPKDATADSWTAAVWQIRPENSRRTFRVNADAERP